MINSFYIGVTLVLREREVNVTKNRVDNVWFKIFNESTKIMSMKN